MEWNPTPRTSQRLLDNVTSCLVICFIRVAKYPSLRTARRNVAMRCPHVNQASLWASSLRCGQHRCPSIGFPHPRCDERSNDHLRTGRSSSRCTASTIVRAHPALCRLGRLSSHLQLIDQDSQLVPITQRHCEMDISVERHVHTWKHPQLTSRGVDLARFVILNLFAAGPHILL